MNGNDAAWVKGVIKDFIRNSPQNTLENLADDKAFDEPLLGFARGDDPIFDAFKEHVGPFHWTPLEIFSQTFPESNLEAGELTVISWVLPLTSVTKADNRKQTLYPSERWARGRIFGEKVNVTLRRLVVDTLTQAGFQAVAPQLSPHWEIKTSERFVLASTWSERHMAFASGLGTFGLCDGLITAKGKALRAGSVVAGLSLPPTPRPYTDHHAYCLFFTHGRCKKCLERCPVGAITEAGHDKMKCALHVRPATEEYVKAHYGFDGYGCGLCQTGVPCESKIPLPSEAE
ncbi:MAG: epoxyqueuosine reductase [Pseudomonadota bacterium]